MGFSCYWASVLRLAFRHSLDHTQYVIFGLLVASGALGALFPIPAMIFHLLGWDIDVTGWQVGAVTFGSIVAIRLALAPYWMYRDKPAGAATDLLERQIKAQEEHTAELQRQREQRERENDPLHRAFAAIQERDNRILLGLEPLAPLEILYDQEDPEKRFVFRDDLNIDDGKTIEMTSYTVGIRNNTHDRSIEGVQVVAEGDGIIYNMKELSALGTFELHPGTTKLVHLFTVFIGKGGPSHTVEKKTVLGHPFARMNRFTIRARGKNAKEASAKFEYDPLKRPMLRRID